MPKAWLAGLLAFLPFCSPAFAAPSDNQLYVWNRAWTGPVRAAVADFADVAQGWRVLVAESDASGRLRPVAVDWEVLAATHRPVTAVIRIDGQLPLGAKGHNPERIAALVHGLPRSVTEIEIDHDCGTARLTDYARFLSDLHGRLAPRRLSITALPAWLGARDLDAVLAAADALVLQVHAVRAPHSGLFDPRTARAWVDALAARDAKPFRVALPDYGSQIVRDQNGKLIAVESEMPRLAGGASAEELMAKPAEVAAFVHDMARKPPAHFAGLAWFRLPVAGDARIWSPATLRLVMRGFEPAGRIGVVLLPGKVAGAADVTLQNDGDTDLPLPAQLILPPGCSLADAVNGYALHTEAQRYSFTRLQNALLRAHHRRIVGWARCVEASPQIQIRP